MQQVAVFDLSMIGLIILFRELKACLPKPQERTGRSAEKGLHEANAQKPNVYGIVISICLTMSFDALLDLMLQSCAICAFGRLKNQRHGSPSGLGPGRSTTDSYIRPRIPLLFDRTASIAARRYSAHWPIVSLAASWLDKREYLL